MRKEVTFAERDMDVGYGSRGLKVKRSIYFFQGKKEKKNLFL